MLQRILEVARQAAVDVPPPLAEYPRRGAIGDIARRHGCNLCFVDVATDPEQAQLLIAELAPEMPVVALHSRADADLILRCLRRGACEFLIDPTAEALDALFERLARARAPVPQKPPGDVYLVLPGKPGCGASTVAAHLAVRLAARGGPVLLVDADALNASIAFLLKLKPEFHLGDAARDCARMDQDLWSRLTVPACGIDVLCAPENPAVAVEIGGEIAAALCSFWRARYDAVVLDLPDARVAAASGWAAQADAALVVATNELAALQATRRAIRYLEGLLPDPARLRLLINRYTPVTGLQRADVKTALGVEPFAVLANDYEILQQALLDGRPAPPGARFTASVDALCRQLRPVPAPDPPAGASWLSLLRPRRKVASGK